MDKRQLNERDICTKFITPALEQAGWDIAARNYNLVCKSPHAVEVTHRDPAELMAEYQDISRQLAQAQQALKAELLAALQGTA